jgi:hypothetical protein
MKLGDFVLDPSTNVHVSSAETPQINYLDGSERYLYEVLTWSHDLGLLSPELKKNVADWPSEYHLSRYRATIVDCFDFNNKEAKVLELGAGCGAVTRWLGEHFEDVHAVEGSFQRAGIARLRCRDLSHVKIYAANFFNLDLDKQFDIVTLIGVLEYSHLYHPEDRKNPYDASLAGLHLVHRALKDQGILVLAIENKLGLKYFSGAKEDHSGRLFDGIQGYPDRSTAVTFSAAELERLLQDAGFAAMDFFLPFPDYKLARTILNAQVLSVEHYAHNWIETPFPDRVTRERVHLFNESLALRELGKAGLLKDLSNSFLIVAHKGDKDINCRNLGFSDTDWIARHYSLDRHPDFCKRVSLLRTDSNALQVVNHQAFDTVSPIDLSDSLFSHALTSDKFYQGDLLLFSVFEMLASGKFERLFQPLLEQFKEFLMERFSAGGKDPAGIPLLSGEATDITLWNIIVEEKTGEWIVFDREWGFKALVPLDFVLWRNLYHLLFTRFEDYFITFHSERSPDDVIYEILQKIFPAYSMERCGLAKEFDQYFQNFARHRRISD